MPSDYKAITEYNVEQLGKDTASRKSQVNMYSDFSHFVFEILQNADDHEATKIKFKLSPEELIIEHNGIPFKEKNVEAISYFGKSTSRDDLIKTGCFGLGFKSVFAITATPSIHSGDENFLIYGLYRLKALQSPQELKTGITRICLPFNHPEEKPDFIKTLTEKTTAFKKISHRLKELDMNTLLFNHNILEIRWSIQDEQGNKKNGHYLRDDENKFKLKISNDLQTRRTEITDGDNLETYLVYSRPINWHNKSYKPVDIAFYLKKENEKEIIYSSLKKLFVLFPTTVDTHMGFLINGPFRTPAHRETVSDEDEFNEFLFQEIALLITDTLIELRQKGFLTISLLETLPIKMQHFSEKSMFYPIADTVRNAFKNEKLLPATDDGVFVSSGSAKIARGSELRKLLTYNQLKGLFGHDEDIHWLPGDIKQNSNLHTYLIKELKVEEVRPERFAQLLSSEFLNKQKDEWYIKFYNFLRGQDALWKKGFSYYSEGTLRRKPIFRCEDGENHPAFDSNGNPLVFLPIQSEMDFPMVKLSICSDDNANSFLVNFGLVKPDICAKVINEILPSFEEEDEDETEEISLEKYKEILNLIDEATQISNSPLYSTLIDHLKTTPWILAENLFGEEEFKTPSELYLPSDELGMYFDGNEGAWFVSDGILIREELLLRIGVTNKVRINCKGIEESKKNPKAEITLWSYHGSHGKGINCFDHNTKVDGLQEALESITVEKAIYIWNKFAILLSRFIKGEIKRATRQDYSNAKTYEYFSKFGSLITKNAWIPTVNGEFKNPSDGDCFIEDLHHDLKKDDHLLKQLGIFPNPDFIKTKGESDLHNIFSNQGLSKDIADFIINNKKSLTLDLLEEALVIYQERQAKPKPQFPTRKSPNPERRKEKIQTKHDQADSKTYEKKERSVKTSRPNHDPKSWLKGQYTNDDQELVCQMCTNEMPFKLKDGSYHFEAVQVSDDFPKDFHELRLALCPLCAAKYRYLVKTDQTIMDNFLNNVKETRENLEIPIELGVNGSHSIHFVKPHLDDLRTILEN